jgi:hypothetical protein
MENDQLNEVYLSERSYAFFYRLFVVVLLAIPVSAYFMGNWWLCFGVLFYLLSSWIAFVTIPFFFLYSIWVWYTAGFSFSNYSTFFLACSIAGFVLFSIARRKILPVSETQHVVTGDLRKGDFVEDSRNSWEEHLN